jgi:hypothetical protein
LPTEPSGSPQQISEAVQQVAERAQLLVREEIELAKAEVTQKLRKLMVGAIVGSAAGVFLLGALMLALHGMSWLLWYLLPVPNGTYFWGFFFMAVVFVLLAGLAGLIAYRLVRRGSPPKPEMALEEAHRIRETVSGSGG